MVFQGTMTLQLHSETNANAQLVATSTTDTAVINETTSSTVSASRSAVNTGTKKPKKKKGAAVNAGMSVLRSRVQDQVEG